MCLAWFSFIARDCINSNGGGLKSLPLSCSSKVCISPLALPPSPNTSHPILAHPKIPCIDLLLQTNLMQWEFCEKFLATQNASLCVGGFLLLYRDKEICLVLEIFPATYFIIPWLTFRIGLYLSLPFYSTRILG